MNDGTINPFMTGANLVSPFLAGILGQQPGMNNGQYMQMGASLGVINPALAPAGMAAGYVADKIVGPANLRSTNEATHRVNEQAFANQLGNPYSGTGYRQYAEGGDTSGGHVIPADKAKLALKHARKAGVKATMIPGGGSPKADDKTMLDANGRPIAVSSGELLIDDAAFQRMADMMGLSPKGYAEVVYPNARPDGGKAEGGPLTNKMLHAPLYEDALAMGNPGRFGSGTFLQPDWLNQPQQDNIVATPMTPNAIPPVNGGDAAMKPKQLLKPAAPITDPNAQTKDQESPVGELDAMNDRMALEQALPMGVSLAYNLFAHRTPGIRPAGIVPDLVDLNTGALAAQLDQQRALSTATANYNARGRSSQSGEAAIHANDQMARMKNAAVVEQIGNQEEMANTQITNRANEMNTAMGNQFNAQETASSNAFRAGKGQAVSQSIQGLSDIVANHRQQRINLRSMGNMNSFYRDYLRYITGAAGTENMELDMLLGTD